MADGYLDLLQRELRQAAVQNFDTTAEIESLAGVEGQLAFAVDTGHLHVYHGGAWLRMVEAAEISDLASVARVFQIAIPNVRSGSLQVAHGMSSPATAIYTSDGAQIETAVEHLPVVRETVLRWDEPLPIGAYAVFNGSPVGARITG